MGGSGSDSDSDSDVKLLGKRESIFTIRIIWALKMKGIQFEYLDEDFSNKSPLLLEANPIYKTVPVLIHAGKSLSESLLILEYIDETWKHDPFILPKDPHQRATARFWARFNDQQLCAASTTAFFRTGKEQAKAVKCLAEGFDLLEGEISGKKFFGGETIGFLDIVLSWIAYMLHILQEIGGYKVMDSTRYPQLDTWIKNFLAVDVIKDNLPTDEDLRAAFQRFRAEVPKE